MEFEKFEVGDLVFSNEDHLHLGVEGESPGIVTEVFEDTFGAQEEVGVRFYPDDIEVRFAPQELTIVGRDGKLSTFENIAVGDRVMMISPDNELIKFLVEDVFRDGGRVDIYGVDSDDLDASDSFEMPANTEVFKVSA